MINIRRIKEKRAAYEMSMKHFKETHKPALCACCLCDIEPGADIVPNWGNEKLYCSFECYCSENDIDKIIFNEGDEDYAYWFEKRDDEV